MLAKRAAGIVLLAVLATTLCRPSRAQTVREAGPPISEALPPGDVAPSASNTPPGDTSNSAEPVATAEELALADVIASVYRSFPMIQQARLERQRATGQLVGAYGAYDTKLQAYSLAEPTGFYRPNRQGLGVARQTWWGGYVSAGYRIGRDNFQPWYKERETDRGGEFSVGLSVPLLQGRAIDPQRVAVFQASLAGRAAEPIIQQAILDASREAASHYWQWVAAGTVLEAQRELLELAEIRGQQFEVGFKAGRFAEIDLILNRRLIAERRGKLIESDQKFRATGFKLSLFLRDEFGRPMVPDALWLPKHFPVIEPLPPGDFEEDLSAALQRRPEPRVLAFELSQVQLEQRLARNNLMPRLDLLAEASQDVGAPASSANDKGRFELIVGIQGEVPIQRRKPRGKIIETAAKIAQINQKLRMQQDKIGAELLTAYNALMLAAQVVEQAEIALRASFDTLIRYRFAFRRGRVDLIYLNLLETNVNETEIRLIDAQRNWFEALAAMQVALGLDPLEQAITVSALPASTRPGPGDLPEAIDATPEELDADWERHANPPDPM